MKSKRQERRDNTEDGYEATDLSINCVVIGCYCRTWHNDVSIAACHRHIHQAAGITIDAEECGGGGGQ